MQSTGSTSGASGPVAATKYWCFAPCTGHTRPGVLAGCKEPPLRVIHFHDILHISLDLQAWAAKTLDAGTCRVIRGGMCVTEKEAEKTGEKRRAERHIAKAQATATEAWVTITQQMGRRPGSSRWLSAAVFPDLQPCRAVDEGKAGARIATFFLRMTARINRPASNNNNIRRHYE